MNSAADLSHLARGPKAVAKVMRPKSVAIVGISSRPGSTGHIILGGLKANKFEGDIHLIGRSAEPIEFMLMDASLAEPEATTDGERLVDELFGV
mgnify:CR=1 FL=1